MNPALPKPVSSGGKPTSNNSDWIYPALPWYIVKLSPSTIIFIEYQNLAITFDYALAISFKPSIDLILTTIDSFYITIKT